MRPSTAAGVGAEEVAGSSPFVSGGEGVRALMGTGLHCALCKRVSRSCRLVQCTQEMYVGARGSLCTVQAVALRIIGSSALLQRSFGLILRVNKALGKAPGNAGGGSSASEVKIVLTIVCPNPTRSETGHTRGQGKSLEQKASACNPPTFFARALQFFCPRSATDVITRPHCAHKTSAHTLSYGSELWTRSVHGTAPAGVRVRGWGWVGVEA